MGRKNGKVKLDAEISKVPIQVNALLVNVGANSQIFAMRDLAVGVNKQNQRPDGTLSPI